MIGHELDCYPKQRIKDARSWDWFLEEPEQDSEGGESFERKKKNGRGKRKKKVGGNDDNYGDDWSGESEEDEVVGKIIKDQNIQLDQRDETNYVKIQKQREFLQGKLMKMMRH